MTSSILAGFVISLGASVFLKTGVPFMFTIGIAIIAVFNLKLITGYIPYSIYKKDFSRVEFTTILLGNIAGALIGAYIIALSPINILGSVLPIIALKSNLTIIELLFSGILAAILIGIGVIGYRESEDKIGGLILLLFCVTVFVTLGCEHIVANCFYFAISGVISIKALVLSLVGNIIGGVIIGKVIDNI